MASLLYCTINVFCIMILVSVVRKLYISVDKRMSRIMLTWFIIAAIILCVTDIIWGVVDFTNSWTARPVWSVIANMSYHMFTGVVSFLWFIYSESEQKSKSVTTKTGIVLSVLPMLMLMLLVVFSAKTGWIFRIDENGLYHRGDYYLVLTVTCYLYMITTSVKALVKSFMKKHFLERQRYRSLFAFCVIPAVAGVLQVIFVGSPMLSAGIAFAALQVYMNSTEQVVSVDPMTQLNNRAQLERHLYHKIKSWNGSRELVLFIMDLDYFKKINDTYGHVEGDEAIMIAADVIKKAVGRNNFFACRYGGDEFVVVADAPKGYRPKDFIAELNEGLERATQRNNKEYTLHFSVGYKRYDESMEDIFAFIAAADEGLYHIKNSRPRLKDIL
ncbi:MAG: GGDEF domain-containing protein [Clostridia bacterium]|nr:GGDEF domain-containing protein [Clostridia bacterium]